MGKVLIIDEAYGLYDPHCPFKKSVIDTIVGEVQNVPGEDRCVLLLGYRQEMEDMMEKSNPGLSRRFPVSDAFQFNDYTNDELTQILELKLQKKEIPASFEAVKCAVNVLAKRRNRPHFGNAGEVENLISQAIDRMNTRLKNLPVKERAKNVQLLISDFDPDHDREIQKGSGNAQFIVDSILKEMCGLSGVRDKFLQYCNSVIVAKATGRDIRAILPFCFRFTGPPGTGKTSVARKMGSLYKKLGILAEDEVVDISASSMIGQYIGHTAPLTRAALDKGLGRVLFIDEAYRLDPNGCRFASEALNELVDQLTKPSYHRKLVIILAGYKKEIDQLMQSNPGLSSRFSETIQFEALNEEECFRIMSQRLTEEGYSLVSSNRYGTQKMKERFRTLMNLPGWGNGRDAKGLADKIIMRVRNQLASFQTGLSFGCVIEVDMEKDGLPCLDALIKERDKTYVPPTNYDNLLAPIDFSMFEPSVNTQTNVNVQQDYSGDNEDEEDHPRDPGVPVIAFCISHS
jgi:hypothetical protein